MSAGAPSRVAIVGGGLLGLQLARRLARDGHRPTILEAAAETGGLAAPAHIGDFSWDRFYHVILLSDLHTRRLLEELGLADRLRWGTTRTGFYVDGTLHSLSTNLEFLTFPPLSLLDKCRLAATILLASRIRDGRRLESELVESWLRRWSGNRVTDKIWLPLLKSKLGDNYRLASASFIWAIIARMYAARRAGLKRELMGYVDGGYALVLQALRQRALAEGVEIVTDARVRRVEAGSDAVQLELADGSRRAFGHAVLTIPTAQIAQVVAGLGSED